MGQENIGRVGRSLNVDLYQPTKRQNNCGEENIGTDEVFKN